ncbi:cytochrome c [Pontibacter sp. G13]|uniref:c-type cytochrome n=1 Tax=Pontibacter sp. G13 TaxID=3074898 RepID=UPI0028893B9B|nr:cytochrome c [Pontibacter sp. G13]WNJ21344.1 cytochrome c [Pontibacter sp. G13]
MKGLVIAALTAGLAGTSLWSAAQSEPHPAGLEIYQEYCMACHMANGQGVTGVYPPLAGADYLLDKPEQAARAIKYGLNGPITVNGQIYNTSMANPGLDDEEVVAVMNYILQSWGNESDFVATQDWVSQIKP